MNTNFFVCHLNVFENARLALIRADSVQRGPAIGLGRTIVRARAERSIVIHYRILGAQGGLDLMAPSMAAVLS